MNLVLTPRVIFEVTSYQATCYPNLSTQNNKSQSIMPFQPVPPPTPRQYLTLRRAQRVLQALRVRVAPEAAARDRRSSLPSPQAQGTTARCGAQGV
jgi:hypothetical protein